MALKGASSVNLPALELLLLQQLAPNISVQMLAF